MFVALDVQFLQNMADRDPVESELPETVNNFDHAAQSCVPFPPRRML